MVTQQISMEQFQQIYDYLKPLACSDHRQAGGASESELASPVQCLDSDFSITDFNNATIDPQTSPLKVNGIWYTGPRDLEYFYAAAFVLDQQDGNCDGQINVQQTQVRMNDLDGSPSQYDSSIFRLSVTGDPNSSSGTAWVVEDEVLTNGKHRHWLLTTAAVADNGSSKENSWRIGVVGKDSISLTFQSVDHSSNVGVLYFDSDEPLVALPISQVKPKKSEWVNAYGFQAAGETPANAANTISNLERYTYQEVPAVVQFSATTDYDNAGSPVFNRQGQVIGLCILPDQSQVSFFTPIEEVLEVYQDIKNGNYVDHGYGKLTDYADFLEEDDLQALGISGFSYGLFINGIPPQNRVFAELEVGDIIVKYDDHSVPDKNNLGRIQAYFAERPNQNVTLHIIRHGQDLDVAVSAFAIHRPAYPTYKTEYGFILKEVDQDYFVYQWNVAPDGESFLALESENWPGLYLSKGILASVNGRSVRTIAEFQSVIETIPTDTKKLVFVGTDPHAYDPEHWGRFIITVANPKYEEKEE